MPRKRSPEGKRVTMSARFSDDEAALIDKARGETERGPWLREAALTAAQEAADARVQERHGIKIIADERMPPGTVGIVSRGRDGVSVSAFSLGADEPEPERSRKPGKGPCEHHVKPGAWCKRCDRLI